MAKRNRDIDNLRREVRKRVQAVNRKIRRYEQLGVNIAGTEFDPRRENAPIDRWRRSDLERYRNNLNQFQSRRNQFVPDAHSRPIPATEWRGYKRLEKRANVIADKNFDEIKDIYIPESGLTIGEREKYFGGDNSPSDPVVNTPFKRVEREPDYITSRKTLAKLTKQMQKKIRPEFIQDFVKNGRAELAAMLEKAERPDIAAAAATLSDKQFHILWGYTGFADAVYLDYSAADGGGHKNAQMQQNQAQSAMDLIEQVKSLDPNNPKPEQSPKPQTFAERKAAMNSRNKRKK